MTEKPWGINPDLQEDRIITLTQVIAEVRGDVIDRHDEELGDTRLSLGMRCYECCRTRLIRLADSKQLSWLAILNKKRRFTFLIGNTSVRFIRYDPKNLPWTKLIPSEYAARQFNLLNLLGYKQYSDLIWYFVFDTEYNHPADRIL